MRPWNEIIAEARDRNKEKAERERRLKITKTQLKGSDALKKAQGKRKSRLTPDELKLRERDSITRERRQDTREKENERKDIHSKWVIGQAAKNAEERKKKQLKDIKDSPRKAASAALSDIKTQSISSKDSDATAYTKVVGNVGSLVGGVAKAGIRYAIEKNKAKKAAAEAENPPKPPGGGGNKPPGGGGGGNKPPGGGSPTPPAGPKGQGAKPKKRVAHKAPTIYGFPVGRLATATAVAGKTTSGKFSTIGVGGENPLSRRIDKANTVKRPYKGNTSNIKEKYSNWRDELLTEQGLIFEVDDKTDDKTEKKKIIDVMRGKNKVELNPNMKEEKDQEGGMAHNELATMERAVKTLRKKIKSPNQQLPAWVQSKISKAADHIDSVADYMSGETEKVTEGYDEGDETFRQHSRETFSSLSPSERRSRTASVLKKMKELNANVEKPKKKKKKKAVAEECGCEDDKKKVLAMMVIKKAIDAKKKKNSQLNSGIIGEESAAWQRKEGKNPEGGLNKKGIASYRRENPGSKLSLAVTTPPSKLKKGSKAAKRRKSFCARMSGMPGPMKDEKGRPTRKALSLRKWNC